MNRRAFLAALSAAAIGVRHLDGRGLEALFDEPPPPTRTLTIVGGVPYLAAADIIRNVATGEAMRVVAISGRTLTVAPEVAGRLATLPAQLRGSPT